MKKPLTGSALKWIAILTMLIDHVGACLIEVFVMSDTMLFKTFCIEQYKLEHHLSGKDTVHLFFQYGVMDYLQSFYDVLHSMGARVFGRGY